MRLRLLAPIVALALVPVVRADGVDDFVRAELKRQNLPGLALCVIKDGKIVKKAGYGMANLETPAPVRPETVFEIGSVTKQFTAFAIMMLVEEGKVKLDEPIRTYLPDLPEKWAPITVRHCLTHTSGLVNYTSAIPASLAATSEFKDGEVVERLRNSELRFAPGEKWEYCNTGYYLLGTIIEKVTGETYWDFLDRRVFKPLAMAATRNSNPRAVIPNRARGYLLMGANRSNANPIMPTVGYAAGSLVSTVLDLAKWDACLREKRLLKPESYAQMWTPYRLTSGASTGYGFGWALDTAAQKHARVAHGGNTLSQSALIERYPDLGLTVVALVNQNNAPVTTISREVARRYAPQLTEKPIKDDPAETEFWKRAFADALSGDIKEELFHAKLREAKILDLIKQNRPALAALGAPLKYELLERKVEAGVTTWRYRVTFEKAVANLIGAKDPEGKIVAFTVQPG
ncbi:MAG: beta-lactamase family protein [Fimbriimonadaceae bacterium]|nr:beta-lactamase family protein [Fimbriimonadaceae bacterium]